MVSRLLTVIILFGVLTLHPCLSFGQDLSGNWVATVSMYKAEARINQNGQSLSGVISVQRPFGQKDEYHVKGSIKDGKILGNHHLGHVFTGNYNPDGKIRGVLITTENDEYDVTARRP